MSRKNKKEKQKLDFIEEEKLFAEYEYNLLTYRNILKDKSIVLMSDYYESVNQWSNIKEIKKKNINLSN